MTSTLHTLKNEVQEVLTNNILPYWINRMIDNRGGFYGRINGHDEIIPESDKGAILNARILWTFSAAYRLFRRKGPFRLKPHHPRRRQERGAAAAGDCSQTGGH